MIKLTMQEYGNRRVLAGLTKLARLQKKIEAEYLSIGEPAS